MCLAHLDADKICWHDDDWMTIVWISLAIDFHPLAFFSFHTFIYQLTYKQVEYVYVETIFFHSIAKNKCWNNLFTWQCRYVAYSACMLFNWIKSLLNDWLKHGNGPCFNHVSLAQYKWIYNHKLEIYKFKIKGTPNFFNLTIAKFQTSEIKILWKFVSLKPNVTYST